jgi:DNA-binding beta-propeller fold protein YncE
VGIKLANIFKLAGLGFAAVCVWLAGCSSGSTANVVVVTVGPPSVILVVNQSQTFLANVTGATDTSVTWTCTFTTSTTAAGATTPTVSAAAPCTAAQGVLTNNQTTTVTYTAPATVPNPPPTITITATSNANKKKTGTATVNLDSGIRVTVTPATATVATGSSFQFHASLTTDTTPNDVTWLVTQATGTGIVPTAATCSPGCGSVDATGLYTAPATVPSTATVTVIATSKLDTTRFAPATITIVQAGPISFSNVSPSVAPQGGLFQDIFLSASNLTSSGVAVNVSGVTPPIDQLSQVKVIFGPSSSSSSIGARLRLNAQQLAVAGSFTVSITSSNPASPVTTVAGGNFTINVVPVSPSAVASNPQSFPQNSQILPTGFQDPAGPFMSIDGGFYGPPTGEVAFAQLNGTSLTAISDPADPNVSTPRRLNVVLPNLLSLPNGPGLYPITVTNHNASPSTAYSNIAIVPDYANTNPPGAPTVIPLPAGSAPSAIAEDSVLGVAVIAETGTSSIQFVDMRTATPALLGGPIPTGSIPASTAPGSLPTGVAVDETLHIAAVVNYADRSLWIFQTPTPPAAPSTTPLGKIDLSTLIPATAPTTPPSAPPFPYSVGIDSQTHRGIVAFASTNVGFIVNLDPAQSASVCLPGQPPGSTPTYCPIASVTLNTGSNPQIAVEPRVDLAYVTPGGGGTLSVLDLQHVAAQARIGITTATRTSNIVTVTTSTPHNLNPGNPGTVLISGLPPGKNGTIFDGTFFVTSVIDASTFTYSQTAADDTTSSTTASPGFVTYGTAFLTFSVTPTVQGIAINPVTRTAILADPNASSSQISFIDSLDQTVSSFTLYSEITGVPSTGLAPESGVADVSFQPFTNTAVSFNPALNEVSMIDPVLLQRDAIVHTGQNGLKTISFTSSGATISLKLSGALQVDPSTNTVLVANSGSDNLSYFKLSTSFKAVNIEQVITPPIPGALLPQAAITTSGSTPGALTGVRILGSGFDGGSVVRLDGQSVPASFVSAREIDATIPASFLAAPRRFALDVVNSTGVVSNSTDFSVIEAIPIPACSGTASAPGAVAIDQQRNIAVVTDSGCSDASIISLKSDSTFGTLTHRIATGASPAAVAVIPRFGFAVVSNNTAGTVSILNLDTNTQATTDVTVGSNPNGLAIDQDTGIALVANTGSNNVSAINLIPLLSTPAGAVTASSIAVNQNPIAVAIDPDRGTNNRGEAVVTSLILNPSTSGLPATGGLDIVDIGASPPSKNTSVTLPQIQATPSGIVFDPATTLFYATSSQGNTVTAFNPDNGQSQSIPVGINPTALAYNYQTGTILTVNALSNTVSIVDSQTFKTRATLGISGSSQFAAAIHPLTNLAVIADQANNRVLLLPLP